MDEIAVQQVVVVGKIGCARAGGNLTLTVTIRAINEGFPAPERIIPHSPVCDMSESLDRSYYDLHDATVNPDHFGMVMQSLYSRENDPKNPEISPIYFDRFSEFPSTFITVDDRETLRADADALHEKLDKAGVSVTMVRMKNAFHAFAPIGTSAGNDGAADRQRALYEVGLGRRSVLITLQTTE